MSSPDLVHRSHLFAPGSNERIVRKALSSHADAVVIDLEDAIDQSRRHEAHAVLASAAAAIADRHTHVRVGIDSGRYRPEDLDLAARLGVEAVRLPKAEDPAAVSEAAARLDDGGSRAVLHPTIESALGLVVLDPLLAIDRVSRVVFGERDFLADVGVDEPGPITDHARAVIAVFSGARGIGTPIDGAFIDLHDADGLRRSCEIARSFGFGGKSALHPNQLDIINTAFSPSPDQVERARAMIGAFETAQRQGDATVLVDGRFVDEAVVRRARSILERGEDT